MVTLLERGVFTPFELMSKNLQAAEASRLQAEEIAQRERLAEQERQAELLKARIAADAAVRQQSVENQGRVAMINAQASLQEPTTDTSAGIASLGPQAPQNTVGNQYLQKLMMSTDPADQEFLKAGLGVSATGQLTFSPPAPAKTSTEAQMLNAQAALQRAAISEQETARKEKEDAWQQKLAEASSQLAAQKLEAQQNKMSKPEEKAQIALNEKIAMEATNASKALPLLDAMQGIVENTSMWQGPIAGRVGSIIRGKDAQTFDDLVTTLAPMNRIPGSGSVSDYDAKALERQVPNRNYDKEVNLAIIRKIRAVHQSAVENGQLMADLIDNGWTVNKARAAVDAWLKDKRSANLVEADNAKDLDYFDPNRYVLNTNRLSFQDWLNEQLLNKEK